MRLQCCMAHRSSRVAGRMHTIVSGWRHTRAPIDATKISDGTSRASPPVRWTPARDVSVGGGNVRQTNGARRSNAGDFDRAIASARCVPLGRLRRRL